MLRHALLTALLILPATTQAQGVATVTTEVPLAATLGSQLRLNNDLFRINSEFNLAQDRFIDANQAFARINDAFTLTSHLSSVFGGDDALRIPAPWAKDDPADSLYRGARESLNNGDYRKAAAQFDDIVRRFPKSAYAREAPYWRAFALYRIGGTPELTEALSVLDKWSTDNPPPAKPAISHRGDGSVYTLAWAGGDRPDVDGLSARIAGVLASRGMGEQAAVRKALAARGNACDSEDQSVKAQALSALMQNNAEQGRAMASRILARRDECSIPLRRNALLILAGRHDATTTSLLLNTVRNDPAIAIRSEAINWLGRDTSDEAVTALDELTRNSDVQIQRSALQALSGSANPRARAMIRTMVDRSETTEAARLNALDGFTRENTSADDATWLRSLYARTTPRVQERVVSMLARFGGDANQQWLLALARRDDEPSSVRAIVLDRLGRTMDIASVNKFYDSASNRQMRESVISLLAARPEPEAVDKLIDIVKNGTDPSVRRSAISALSRSKDPRAAKLLLELVDK